MKNLFRPLLVLTGCIVLASCVSQKQFKGLKTDYTKLQTEYQESQLQLRENQARSTSLEERLAEAQRNNSELRKSLSDMQSILNKSLTQSSQGNMNMGKLIDEINASNRFIQHLVKEKNRSDSLNLVMVNKLTRSLTREEMRDLDIKVLKGVVYISLADNMLYKSGSYEISNKAEAVLSKIAKIIPGIIVGKHKTIGFCGPLNVFFFKVGVSYNFRITSNEWRRIIYFQTICVLGFDTQCAIILYDS